MKRILLIVPIALAASAAIAHQGVKDPSVKAWMAAMSDIGAATKVIGEMAKGTTPFDAGVAREAARTISSRAARIPDLFAAKADDPKSEALPAIWTAFDDFTLRAQELEEAARKGANIKSEDDLRPALASIGETCKSCHAVYRE